MLRVLSTKILDEKLVDTARDVGMSLDCIEVIGMRVVDFDRSALQSDTYDAIVFTSSNAVKSFLGNKEATALAPSPLERAGGEVIYSISGKTKDELEKNGIVPVAVADSSEQLAEKIVSEGNVRSALHICGNLRMDVLEKKLTAAGISYKELVVYETKPLDNKVDASYDAVMFYSPSGVESFLEKNKLNRDILYCCIGETTAAKLKSIDGNVKIVVAKEPKLEAMLTAIKQAVIPPFIKGAGGFPRRTKN